jgi:hypothetical protein
MSNFQKHRLEYIYLNNLRESGVTNMFGATPYLEEDFDIGRKEAKAILMGWMAWVNENPSNVNLY